MTPFLRSASRTCFSAIWRDAEKVGQFFVCSRHDHTMTKIECRGVEIESIEFDGSEWLAVARFGVGSGETLGEAILAASVNHEHQKAKHGLEDEDD